MADGFIAFDADWACIFVNTSAELLLGVPPEQLLGRDHWQSAISFAGTRAETQLRQVAARQVVSSFEMEHLGRVFDFRAYPLPGRAVALRIRDVSDVRRTGERLQLAVDTTGLGLWEYEIATDRLFWDERTRSLCGAPKEFDVAGFLTFVAAVHPEDRARVETVYHAAVEPGGSGVFDSEFRVVGLVTRVERWLLGRGRAFFDSTGVATRLIGTVLDISERKVAEEQLRQNEQRLRLAVDAVGLGTWDHDVRTDERTWSDTAYRLLGVSPQVQADRDMLTRLIHPEDEARTAETYRRAFEPGSGGTYQNEFRINRCDNGEERWLSLHGRVLFDAASRPVRALGIAHDVTEAKRVETTLRLANEGLEARVAQRTRQLEEANRNLSAERTRLGAILEQLPFGVLVATRDGALVLHNAAARTLVSRDVSTVRHWSDFSGVGAVDGDGQPLQASDYAMVQAIRHGVVTERKLQPFVTSDGRHLTLAISAAPVRDAAGEIALGVVAMEDVTARLKAEESLRRAQRLEAIGQLTGGVAHDFNNLLTAILGNLEILARRVDEPRSARLVQNAAHAAERGAQLTGQLLAFARKQRLQTRPTDVNELVRSMTALLRGTLGGTIEVEPLLAPDLWPALADPVQLELVVLNLAINARDAMPEGGRLTIRTENASIRQASGPEDPPAGNFVALSVADDGSGMAPEVLAHIFEPFFTTKEVGKGSGLGLPQVLGVAQQMGGGVRVVSRPGVGTNVTVYLPQTRAELGAHEAPADREVSSLAGLSVLLVDDDPDVRESVAELLQELGAAVVLASNGAEALERVGSHFDAVLLDFAMPLMNGLEIAAHLRQLYPRLPIVLITGHADELVTPESAVVLRKPFQASEMARAIRRGVVSQVGLRS